jgi:hypothetical protein
MLGSGKVDFGTTEYTITWVDQLVASNPQGVMQVLARNGYTGYLAPQNEEELADAAYDFLERNKDLAVRELLKSHTLYDVIAGIAGDDKFKNAEDNSVVDQLKKLNYKDTIKNVLMVIGILYIADKLWSSFK